MGKIIKVPEEKETLLRHLDGKDKDGTLENIEKICVQKKKADLTHRERLFAHNNDCRFIIIYDPTALEYK